MVELERNIQNPGLFLWYIEIKTVSPNHFGFGNLYSLALMSKHWSVKMTHILICKGI